MNETEITTLLAVFIYFALLILFGIVVGKKRISSGFAIDNRGTGIIPTICSLSASSRDGMGLIFWFAIGAFSGYWGIWLLLGAVAGYLLYIPAGTKAHKTAKKGNFITIGELIARQIGTITEKSTALVTIAIAMLVIVMQIFVSGYLFSSLFGGNAWLGATVVTCIVLAYLLFGGYASIIKTDMVQFFLIIPIVFVPFLISPLPTERFFAFDGVLSMKAGTSVAFFIMGLFYVFSSADIWQRAFSARDNRIIGTAFPLSGIFLALTTLGIIFLGMASAQYLGQGTNKTVAFFDIFKTAAGSVPAYLLPYIAIMALAVCMSTMDNMLYLISSTISRNIMNKKTTDDEKDYKRISRYIMIAAAVLAVIITLVGNRFVFAFLGIIGLVYMTAPIYVLAALGYPRNRNILTDVFITISMAICGIVYIYLLATGAFDDSTMFAVLPVLLNVVFVAISLPLGRIMTKGFEIE